MNMLEALLAMHTHVANTCGTEPSKHLCAAMKVVEKKIVGLQRKAAWRGSSRGAMPSHMTDPNHPLNRFMKQEEAVEQSLLSHTALLEASSNRS